MKNLFFTASAALILAGCTQVSSEIVIEKPRRSEMLQEYYISRVEKNMEQTRRAVAKAKTRQDAMRLVENARKKVQSSFKNVKSDLSLQSRCTGVAAFPGYTVEKHLIRTRENFSMSVNLYLPEKGKKPLGVWIFHPSYIKTGSVKH